MNVLAYATAWRSGKVCLHPTDTLPGLSFHPELKSAEEAFIAVKERPDSKKPISLVAEWGVAARCWKPLPGAWEEILRGLWPGSLSVIWEASAECPASLLASDGTCALRMPAWTEHEAWMRELLLELKMPFPSSSVNVSGDPPALTWASAVAFAAHASQPVFLPDWQPGIPPPDRELKALPSTVIRLDGHGGYSMLREGAVSRDTIEKERLRHAGVQRPR